MLGVVGGLFLMSSACLVELDDGEVSVGDGDDEELGFAEAEEELGGPLCYVQEPQETHCRDGIDNDCDGQIDGDDLDCKPDGNCLNCTNWP